MSNPVSIGFTEQVTVVTAERGEGGTMPLS